MKILYLYAEVMGYTIATMKELVRLGYEVHVVAWSKGKKSSYNLENVSGVTFYDRHILSTSDLHDLAFSIRPVITVVSGWMDYGYLRVAFSLRSRNSLVVCGLDSQWNSTFRQHIASLLGSLGFFTRFFSIAG